MAAATADEAPRSRRGEHAPADRKPAVSHKRGAGKHERIRLALVSYYGFLGMAISARNPADGMVWISYAEPAADAWIDLGKANPAVMRVLEIICVGGPFTAVLMLHGRMAFDLMKNHNTSPMALFQRTEQPEQDTDSGPAGMADGGTNRPGPLPYMPVGPSAPTEAPAPMPAYNPDELRVFPDEGISHDEDIALRQLAKQLDRPYDELRTQLLLERAQASMARNGHVVQAGALGAPIARE